MTSDEESKARAREYVEAVRDASLERATPDKRAAVLGYWNSRGAMFRSLARYTIEAVREGRSGQLALRWSLAEFRNELLRLAQNDVARQQVESWLAQRESFLRSITERLLQQATRDQPPKMGLWLALEAHPNPDYDRSDYRGSVSVPMQWVQVANLDQAQRRVRQFIESNQLGGGNWSSRAGRVARDGLPWVQVSYNGRLWMGWAINPQQEVDTLGNPIPSVELGLQRNTTSAPVRSYKAEMKIGREWSSNRQRWATPDEAYTAGTDLLRRWTAADDFRVVPSDDPPNMPEPVMEVATPPVPAPTESKILFGYVGDRPASRSSVPNASTPNKPKEESVLRYSLQVKGKWGRMRSESVDHWDLAKRVDPNEPWPLDRLLQMMRNKLTELKVKPGARLRILEQPWTIHADGAESTILLSEKVLHEEILR